DVDLVALEIDRLDHLRQQLAGAADERDALDVFVAARRLADEHEVGVGIADAEHDLLASLSVQLAPAAAGSDVRADGREDFAGTAEDAHGRAAVRRRPRSGVRGPRSDLACSIRRLGPAT